MDSERARIVEQIAYWRGFVMASEIIKMGANAENENKAGIEIVAALTDELEEHDKQTMREQRFMAVLKD